MNGRIFEVAIMAALALVIPAFADDVLPGPPTVITDLWEGKSTQDKDGMVVRDILNRSTNVEPRTSNRSELVLLMDEPAKAEPAKEAPAGSDAELAKKLANPIANMISITFEFNYDEGYGPKDAGFLRLNIQPVIPFSLNKDWNLITRTIVPVIYQGSVADGVDSQFGLGDTIQSFWFSPTELTNGWTWGVGPVFNWPTATDDQLGSGKWGVGPTVVMLKQEKGWTYGALGNHIWSFAGDSDREEINATFIQPFISYTFPSATTVGLNTESTYDWNSSQWTVPINLKVSQVVRLGKLPVQFTVAGRWYAESPDDGPEWGARFTMTIMLPK